MDIIQESSPNYRSGRKGKNIIAIVDHQTAGKSPGCISWLCNPSAQASAHYVVTRTGEIHQLVADENTAWHAGAVANPTWCLYDGTNPNYRTIGIEHECYPDVGGDGNLTEEQYQATLWLHRQLIAKHGIPIDREHIIGHYQIDSVNRPNCPGSAFPWARLMNDLLYPPVTIKVGGKTLAGIIGGQTSLAPVHDLAVALGTPVTWDAATNTAVVGTYTGTGLAYGKTDYIKIAVGYQLLIATIINNRAYAPVAKIAQLLGYSVNWDAASYTVTVG